MKYYRYRSDSVDILVRCTDSDVVINAIAFKLRQNTNWYVPAGAGDYIHNWGGKFTLVDEEYLFLEDL